MVLNSSVKCLSSFPLETGLISLTARASWALTSLSWQLEIVRKLRQLDDWEFFKIWYLLRSFPRELFWCICLSISRTCSDHRGQIP